MQAEARTCRAAPCRPRGRGCRRCTALPPRSRCAGGARGLHGRPGRRGTTSARARLARGARNGVEGLAVPWMSLRMATGGVAAPGGWVIATIVPCADGGGGWHGSRASRRGAPPGWRPSPPSGRGNRRAAAVAPVELRRPRRRSGAARGLVRSRRPVPQPHYRRGVWTMAVIGAPLGAATAVGVALLGSLAAAPGAGGQGTALARRRALRRRPGARDDCRVAAPVGGAIRLGPRLRDRHPGRARLDPRPREGPRDPGADHGRDRRRGGRGDRPRARAGGGPSSPWGSRRSSTRSRGALAALLEPVFQKTEPLRDRDLSAQVLELAERAGVEADDVVVTTPAPGPPRPTRTCPGSAGAGTSCSTTPCSATSRATRCGWWSPTSSPTSSAATCSRRRPGGRPSSSPPRCSPSRSWGGAPASARPAAARRGRAWSCGGSPSRRRRPRSSGR